MTQCAVKLLELFKGWYKKHRITVPTEDVYAFIYVQTNLVRHFVALSTSLPHNRLGLLGLRYEILVNAGPYIVSLNVRQCC